MERILGPVGRRLVVRLLSLFEAKLSLVKDAFVLLEGIGAKAFRKKAPDFEGISDAA